MHFSRNTASDYEANPEGWAFTVVATSTYGRIAHQQVRVLLNNLDEPAQVGVFSASPVQGRALSAPSVSDPDGAPGNIRWQWQNYDAAADTPVWTDIDGSRSEDYQPGPEDIGKTLRVVITYTDTDGQDKTVISASSAPVPATTPPTALKFQKNNTDISSATINEMDSTSRTELADLVFDDDGGANPVTLSGKDAALFEVVSGKLYLKAGQTLDQEANGAKASYMVTVTSDLDRSVSAAFTLTVTDINDASPVFTSGSSGTARPENTEIAIGNNGSETNFTDNPALRLVRSGNDVLMQNPFSNANYMRIENIDAETFALMRDDDNFATYFEYI